MKHISVVTPCWNEKGNVALVADQVRAVFDKIPDAEYELIFADNASTDGTVEILQELAAQDPNIKVILNSSNYGSGRSTYNAILAASGEAIVLLAADLQDPPELIAEMIEQWRAGYKIVFGIRARRSESRLMTAGRRIYYRILQQLSEDELVNDAGDFVLFDSSVQEVLAQINDANPYIRGLLSSLGFTHTGVEYHMQPRHSGKSAATPYKLFAYAMNGFVNHSLFPLRMATFSGLIIAAACFVLMFVELVLRLFSGNTAPPGVATLIIVLLFLGGVQLCILGFIGEFVGALYRQSKNIPIVIEKERINF